MPRPHKTSHTTIRLVLPPQPPRPPGAVPRATVTGRREIDAGLRRYLDAVARADEARTAHNARRRSRARPTAAEREPPVDPWLQAIERLAAAAPPLDRPTKRSPRGRRPTAVGRDHRPLSLASCLAPVLSRHTAMRFATLAELVVQRLTGTRAVGRRIVQELPAYSQREIRIVLSLDDDDPLDVADRSVWIENLRNRLKRDLRLGAR